MITNIFIILSFFIILTKSVKILLFKTELYILLYYNIIYDMAISIINFKIIVQ